MLLPIGDTPKPSGFVPYATLALIAVNVGIYFFVAVPLGHQSVDLEDPAVIEYFDFLEQIHRADVPLAWLFWNTSAYDVVLFHHGFKPGAPEMTDLFTSMFLHGGLAHLLGNVLFLWIFGLNVEHRLGRFGYLTTYLTTGMMATMTFAVFAGDSMRPLVGASGAISGVLGIYFLLFKRNRVKIFVLLFPFLFHVFLIPARWVLGFYIIVDNLLPFLLSSETGIAHGAHIGGFVGGVVVAAAGQALVWRLPWRGALGRAQKVGSSPGAVGAPQSSNALGTLRDAIARGDRSASLAAIPLLEVRTLARLKPTECAQLAGWLAEEGQRMAAASVLLRCIATHRRETDDSEMAAVYLALGLLRLQEGQEAAAYQHLLTALEMSPDAETASKARAALDQINIYRRQKR